MQKVSNYRYTLTDRLGFIVASPLGESDFSIEWTRDNDEGKRTYKKEFGGKIIFTGEAYTRLYRMERTIYRCEYQKVTIEKKCVSNGVATWSLWFSGLISLNEGAWDLDNCRVETKFEEDKPEQCFVDNKSEKINLFQSVFNRRSILMLPNNVQIETKFCQINATSQQQPTGDVIVGDPIHQGQVGDTGSTAYYGGYYWCGTEARPEDGGWVAYEHSESDDGIHHRISTSWARQVMTLDCLFVQNYISGWIMVENNCVTAPGGAVTGTKKYAKPATVFGCEYDNGDGTVGSNNMTCKIFGQDSANTVFDNGLPLPDVLNAFVLNYCPGITIKSDFFQINPQNPSNINYVTGKPTKVNYITLFQKSDVKRPNAAGNASKMEWSWDKLMTTLKYMFNVEWRIENSKLVIEHTSFFKSGIGMDLTQPKYAINVKGKRKYTYTNDTIPKQEVWTFKESSNGGDFPGLPIVYTNGCVTRGGKDTIKTYAIEDVMTDVEFAVSNPASDSQLVSDEGIVFMAAQKSGDTYSIISEPGILETNTRVNNSLALAQLMRDYHRYNRPLKSGRLNGYETTFLSVEPTKKGTTISIPFCCGDSFDPDDTITTPLGVGIVDKAKFNFMSSTLELDLLYEANINLETNKTPVATNDTVNTDKDVVAYINILANDTDEPGDIITNLEIVVQPQHGTIEVLPDMRIKYSPASGYVGDDYFVYNFSDKWFEKSNNALVAINIKGTYTVPPTQKKTVWVKLVQSPVTLKSMTQDCDGVPQYGGQRGTANFTLYFYQDQQGTVPLDVTGYGLHVNLALDFHNVHAGADQHDDISVTVPGGSAYTWAYDYIVSENYIDCNQDRIFTSNSVLLNVGTGYTRVGETPVVVPPPVDPGTPMPDPVPIPVKEVTPLTGSLRNLPIAWGTAFKDGKSNNTTYTTIIKNEYDLIAPENAGKFGHIQGVEGTWDFSDMDIIMDWAKANGKTVFSHNVVWPKQMPNWFDTKIADMTETQVMQIIFTHLDKFLDRYMAPEYAGVLTGIIAANEPYNDNGTPRTDTMLVQRAPNYIKYIVKHINDKAPGLLVFINDYGQEYGSANKLNNVIALKAECAAFNARLDGIGFQMHAVARMDTALFNSRIQAAAAAGLMVHISEFDILMKNGTDINNPVNQGDYPFMTPALDKEKARVISEVVNYYLTLPAWARYGFATWSIADDDNYINRNGLVDYPGLRDANYRPVPAMLKLESRAMELRNLLIYDNYRTGARATIAGTSTNGGQVAKPYTVAGTTTGFGTIWVTDKGLQAKTTTNAALVMATVDVGVANFIMVIGLSDILSGIADDPNKNVNGVFRFLDVQNHWFFGPSNSLPGAPWALSKKISSANTLYVQDTKPASPNDVAAVVCSGNTISLYVNGKFIGSTSSADLNNRTKAGLKFKGNVDTVSAVDFLAIGV